MSLEQALAANTEALNRVAALLQGANITNNPAAPVIPTPPMTQTFPPPPVAAPAAPAMPAAPAWNAPAAAPGLPPLPFNEVNGLVQYASDAWTAISATKPEVGDQITAAFQTLGAPSIQQLDPQHYREFYNRVESLR